MALLAALALACDALWRNGWRKSALAPVVGSVKPERITDMLNGPETLPREAWYELLEAARGHCVA